MRFDITLKGKWMYSREDVSAILGLMYTGVLNVQNLIKIVGKFGLEDWKEALDVAWEQGGRLGQVTVFNP
jgi:hypothetical protein